MVGGGEDLRTCPRLHSEQVVVFGPYAMQYEPECMFSYPFPAQVLLSSETLKDENWLETM